MGYRIKKCNWCGCQFKTIDGLIQMVTGTEKFCSIKCKTEYLNQSNNSAIETSLQNIYNTANEQNLINLERERERKREKKENLIKYHFEKLSKLNTKFSEPVYGEIYIDKQGKEYKSIVVDETMWITEDLQTKFTSNGKKVPITLKDIDLYDQSYQNLYPYFDVAIEINQKLDDSWRLPNKEDWNKLISYYGGNNYAIVPLVNSLSDNEYEIDKLKFSIPENWINSSGLNFCKSRYFVLNKNKWSWIEFNDEISIKTKTPKHYKEYKNLNNAQTFSENIENCKVRLVKDIRIQTIKNKTTEKTQIEKDKTNTTNFTNQIKKLKDLQKSKTITKNQYRSLVNEVKIEELNYLLKENYIDKLQYHILKKQIEDEKT
jgi:uncharacterized protein (TIGR02145 family)